MSASTLLALAALLASCAAAPPATTPANSTAEHTRPTKTVTVTVAPFGEIAIDDGALVLADRGNGDERVHYMTVSRDFHGTKRSRADKPGAPSGVQTGTFPIDASERDWVRSWIEAMWPIAPSGRRTFKKPPPDGPTVYEWAIVMRRGDQVRIVEGGPQSDADPAPDVTESIVDFLDMHF
jgi:hypothetical protein